MFLLSVKPSINSKSITNKVIDLVCKLREGENLEIVIERGIFQDKTKKNVIQEVDRLNKFIEVKGNVEDKLPIRIVSK